MFVGTPLRAAKFVMPLLVRLALKRRAAPDPVCALAALNKLRIKAADPAAVPPNPTLAPPMLGPADSTGQWKPMCMPAGSTENGQKAEPGPTPQSLPPIRSRSADPLPER